MLLNFDDDSATGIVRYENDVVVVVVVAVGRG